MSSPYNRNIITNLKRLSVLRLLQDEKWESRADEKAIATIQGLDHDLTSGAEAQKYPNIGKGIGAHIDQILSNRDPTKTGIPDLDMQPVETRVMIDSLMDLMTVTGVGIKEAVKYYQQGLRSAADLASLGHVIRGKSGEVTSREAIGIKYLQEFKKRIPREEVDKFIGVFRQFLDAVNKQMGTQVNFTVTGSYRRDFADVGDIDILLVSQIAGEAGRVWPTLQQALATNGWLKETISDGDEKYEGVALIDSAFPAVRIDVVKINDIWQYPYALLYFTGSKEFNIKLRQYAKAKGYHLANLYMTDPKGKNVQVMDEKGIFDTLGVPYLEPNRRTGEAL